MTENSNISFVIPAYNCATTLVEAVESIYAGNVEAGDEVILVNDASTDTTADVITWLTRTHPGIVALNNLENKGCPATRNVGIRAARNGFVFNLDADNILVRGSVSRLKALLIDRDVDLAAFSEYHYFMGRDKNVTHKWVYPYDTLTLADVLASHFNPGPGGNFLYTKASWTKIGGYSEYGKGLNEAWGFVVKQLANGARMAVLPHSHYLHRYGVNSLFDRETRLVGESSRVAYQMLVPFLELLRAEDVAYVQSDAGSKRWFEDLGRRPIRLRSGELGRCGYEAPGVTAEEARLKKIARMFLPHSVARWLREKRAYRRNVKDFQRFRELSLEQGRGDVRWEERGTQLHETTSTGGFDPHYIYQIAWAARAIRMINPQVHVDISSTLEFASILSAFVRVRCYNYRLGQLKLSNLDAIEADLTRLTIPDASIASLSCMQMVEYVGLGRYGDTLDPAGDVKAVSELKRVLAKGGNLLFAVPVGRPRVVFNTHRVYSYEQVMSFFSGLELVEFALVPDDASRGLIRHSTKEEADAQTCGGGCFWFRKDESG